MRDILEHVPTAVRALSKHRAEEKAGSLKDRGFRSVWHLNQFVDSSTALETFLPIGRVAGSFLRLPFVVLPKSSGSSGIDDGFDFEACVDVRCERLPARKPEELDPSSRAAKLGFYMIPLPQRY